MNIFNSTQFGYKVQARVERVNYANPVRLSDGVLTEEWRTIDFPIVADNSGFPIDWPWSELPRNGLVEYEVALALAWGVIARNPNKFVECRLTRHKVVFSSKLTDEGPVDIPLIKHDHFKEFKAHQPAPASGAQGSAEGEGK